MSDLPIPPPPSEAAPSVVQDTTPVSLDQQALSQPDTTDTQTVPTGADKAPHGSKAQLYDISGKTPVLGDIAHDEVTDAVASGHYSFPKGSPINVIAPDGTHGTLDPHEAPEAFQNGYTYATPKDLEQAKYGAQGLAAGLEGLAQGVAGPLATLAETTLGIAGPKDIRGRAEANPIAHGIGETAGFIGSLATGVGEGALVESAGKALAKNVEGMGLLSDAARGATKVGTEMALLGTGDEVSKLITEDPNQSVQSAITNIGLSAALGGLLGGSTSGASSLWKASGLSEKASQFAADMGGRFKWAKENGSIQDTVVKELGDHYAAMTDMGSDVYGPQGLKTQEIQKLVPEIGPKITEQTQSLADDMTTKIKKMINKPNSYPERLTSKLQDDLNEFTEKVTAPNASSNDVFGATQDLKQKMQNYAKYDKFVKPVDESYDFVRDSKDMAFKLRNALEDDQVWGKAAERQQSLNKAFVKAKPGIEDFESAFTSEVANPEGGYKRVVDPGKVATLINQTDKASGELKRMKLKNYFDVTDNYSKEIGKTHANLGLESPLLPTSLHATKGILGKLTPGAAMADWLIQKGIKDAASNAAAGTIGALGGHLTGIPGGGIIGQMLGQNVLSPAFKSTISALAKPIMETAAKGEALKSALDYGVHVAKGTQLIGKATSNVFRIGSEVLSESQMPTASDRAKLDKYLKVAQTNPNALLNNQSADGHGHYLPGHATALAQTAQTAITLLNQQRPAQDKISPLDSKPVIDKAHQAAFNRTLDIAQQPLVVLHHIKQGSLLPSDVATVQQLYPQLYQKLSQSLTQEMISHTSKGDNTVPYKTRMGLSLFLAKPMDSTMLPAFIIAAQPQPNQGPAQQEQASGGKGTNHSASGLNKMAQGFQTKSQNREQDRASKA